jgi:alanine dehydrogenase
MSAQKKVVILDSIQANKIITELVQKDFLSLELKTLIKMDSVSRLRIDTLIKSNSQLMLAYKEKDLQVGNLNLVIKNKDKIISKEKSKNKFLKVVSLLSLGMTGILLITR